MKQYLSAQPKIHLSILKMMTDSKKLKRIVIVYVVFETENWIQSDHQPRKKNF